ncbi:MAG: TonB family protein [Bacteroidota bacterium]
MADNKYKIVTDYVPPADEEISEMMDFDVLRQQLSQPGASNATVFKVLLGLGAFGLAFTLLVLVWKPKAMDEQWTNDLIEWPQQMFASGLPETKEVKQWVDNRRLTQKITIVDAKPPQQKPGVSSTEKQKHQTKETALDDQPKVTPNKFTDASPVVGFDSLYRYLRESLIYPVEPPGDTIQGVVEIMFLVGNEGQITDPKVMTSLGEAFDKEALRVIKNMPPWTPAMVNEIPMSIRKQIAIQFRKKTKR